MIRFADWRRPTDDGYAFRLATPVAPRPPGPGAVTDLRDVVAAALVPGDAERFERRVERWGGPEDVDAHGRQPYLAPQTRFRERGAGGPITADELEEVLAGTGLVDRADGRVDYVLRDHHVLDVVLYHWWSTGALPTGLFHADRHSDWCKDSFLLARRPPQAATWWALLPGLKRPGGGAVLEEDQVLFTTACPADGSVGGRDVGASTRVPGVVDRADLPWQRALERLGEVAPDWVSLDLDDFLPAAQLRLTAGLLRDPRLGALLAAAAVRIFVLSPQFTAGGDLVDPWVVRGSRSSSRRLLNWLRVRGHAPVRAATRPRTPGSGSG